MKQEKNLRRLFAFGVLFLGFAGYSYMSAASTWVAPGGAPPTNNVDAPVNVGTTAQIKNGPLGTDNLSVTGNQNVSGYITVSSTPNYVKVTNSNITLNTSYPQIIINDTDSDTPSRFLYASRALYFQTNRDGSSDGSYDSPPPLLLNVGTTSATDYLYTSNQIRSPEYCDESGNSCFDPSEVGQTNAVLDNFGGMFAKDSGGTCKSQNPLTLGCSCPAGYDVETLATGMSGTMSNLYYCQANVKTCTVQFTTSANVSPYAVKTGNTTYSKNFPEGTLIDVGQIYYGSSQNYPNAYMDARITGYLYDYSGMTSSGYSIQQGWWYDTTYKQYQSILSGYTHPIKLLTVLSGKTATSTFTTDWNKGASQEQSGIGGTITATVTSCI